MELIYRAWDGTEFDERDACEKYEHDNPRILMYHNTGRTSISNDAFVVVLRNDNDAKNFIKMCKEQDTDYKGITEDDYGLYVWDELEQRYFYVSERVEDALKRYFED